MPCLLKHDIKSYNTWPFFKIKYVATGKQQIFKKKKTLARCFLKPCWKITSMAVISKENHLLLWRWLGKKARTAEFSHCAVNKYIVLKKWSIVVGSLWSTWMFDCIIDEAIRSIRERMRRTGQDERRVFFFLKLIIKNLGRHNEGCRKLCQTSSDLQEKSFLV